MNYAFEDRYQKIELSAPVIFGLDFSDDGSLLAVAHATAGDSPAVRVYRTTDASPVAEYGAGMLAGRGVAFDAAGESLFLLLQDELSEFSLLKAPLSGGEPEKVASYASEERLHGLARDREGRCLAVLGTGVEVRDLGGGTVIRFKEGAEEYRPVYAAFSGGGPHLLIYGIRVGEVVLLEVERDEEIGTWPAPQPFGQQVASSPTGGHFAAVGEGMSGVFIYDTAANARFNSDFYNETSLTQPFLFSHDGSLLLSLEMGIVGERLSDGNVVEGPKLETGRASAAASCRKAPIFAYAIKQNVYWIRLRESGDAE